MWRASPEEAAELSRRGEPNNAVVLIVVLAVSLASLVGVAAMLNRPRPPALGDKPSYDGVAARRRPVLTFIMVCITCVSITTTALSTAN
jgi:hypothetical protein